jgi:hypothetical protein
LTRRFTHAATRKRNKVLILFKHNKDLSYRFKVVRAVCESLASRWVDAYCRLRCVAGCLFQFGIGHCQLFQIGAFIMLSRIVFSAFAGLALCAAGSTTTLAAATQLSANAFSVAAEPVSTAENISFSARPFPYGYRSWGRCIRYVPVETSRGVSYRRVSVCRSRF